MTTIAVTVVLLVAQLMASAAQERAQEPATTDAPDAATPSIRSFADTDKLCAEWSDGCHACRRVGTDEPACSNIGIACQPGEIICTRREEATK